MKATKTRYFLASCLLLLLFPMISHAHSHMEKSQPAKGEVLTTAPTVVQLWFSGAVESEWSKIEVTNSKGERVDDGAVSAIGNDANSLQINLKPISSGKYDVKWNAISHDGHRIKGNIDFSVK